jgi:Na+-driven multidrug efflux pump
MLLDPLLMLGIGPFPKLGVNGAAFAGLAAQLTSCIYAFFKVLQQRNNLYLNSTTFKLDWGIIKQINKRGFFNILQVVIINLGLLVTQYYVNIFGSNSIAIFGAVMIIIDGLLYFTWSVALAVSILAGQAFGAKNQQELVKILLSGCYIVLVPVTIVSIVSLIATKYIFVIFFNVANNFSLLHECTFAIKVMAIAYPCLALNVLINAFLNGVGSNRIVTIIMTISTLFLRIPLLYILGLHFSINGVWFALCITYVLSCGFTCLYLWMKKHNYLNVVI